MKVSTGCTITVLLMVLILSVVHRQQSEAEFTPISPVARRSLRKPPPAATPGSDYSHQAPPATATAATANTDSRAAAGHLQGRQQQQESLAEDDTASTAVDPPSAPTHSTPAPPSPTAVAKATKKGDWGNLTCADIANSRPDLKVTEGPPRTRGGPGMVVKFAGEFGYEMGLFLPYVHYLSQRGLLRATISVPGTTPFYWFSPCHIENKNAKRKNTGYDMVHEKFWNPRRWSPPSYKMYESPKIFNFTKPIVLIHNKYSQEWHDGKNKFGAPVNFIPVHVLRCLFLSLTPHYQVIYSRPRSGDFVGDDQGIGDLEDYKLLAEEFNSTVMIFADLVKEASNTTYNNYNSLQLHIHAITQRFISVQGGSSYISSLFGGTNIIFHRKYGGEWSHKYQPYTKLFPRLSRARIMPVKRCGTLLKRVRENYLADVQTADLPECMRPKDDGEAASGAD